LPPKVSPLRAIVPEVPEARGAKGIATSSTLIALGAQISPGVEPPGLSTAIKILEMVGFPEK